MFSATTRSAVSRVLAINSKSIVNAKSPVTSRFLEKLQTPVEISAGCRFKSGGAGGVAATVRGSGGRQPAGGAHRPHSEDEAEVQEDRDGL